MIEKKSILLKNIISLGSVQIANYLFPLISIPIISRIVGPEKLGIINYSAAFTTYFILLISFGFDLTATRRVSVDPTNQILRSKIFSEIFFAKILLFIVSVFLFSLCLLFFPPLINDRKVAFFSFLICIGTIFNQNWLFQAMQELPKVAIMNFISKLLFTFSILLIVKVEQDYLWQPLLMSSIQILVSFFSFFWAIKKYQLQLIVISFHSVLQILWMEKTVFFSIVVISLYTTTNTVVLGFFQPVEEVGYYTASLRLMEVASSVINIPLAQALYPFIAVAFADNMEKGILVVQKIIPLILIFTLLIAFVMFLLGPYVLFFFYGSKFAPSLPVFQLMTFMPMIIAMSNVFGIQVMLNLKMDKLFLYITAGGALLGFFLNIIMVNIWGYIGTAINWLVVEIYITLTMYAVLRNKGINVIDFSQFKISSLILQIKPITDKILHKI